ncbi:MAG: hypothetical protein HOP09_10620 [Hyphomicrobium sp.]|nr:hypothetical protein [Hyphomicrobium sp.]
MIQAFAKTTKFNSIQTPTRRAAPCMRRHTSRSGRKNTPAGRSKSGVARLRLKTTFERATFDADLKGADIVCAFFAFSAAMGPLPPVTLALIAAKTNSAV